MDGTLGLTIVGLVIAGAAAVAALWSAITAASARDDSRDAIRIADEAKNQTKRIADATEKRVQLVEQQMAEERERAKPDVRVQVLDSWISSQGIDTVDVRIRFTVQNLARSADVLQDIRVGFGHSNYRLPPGTPPVRCYDADGKPVRLPMHLESDKPIELALELSSPIAARLEPGWTSPAVVDCKFEHAARRLVDAPVRIPG